MASGTKLHIYPDLDATTPAGEDTFVIDEELGEVSQEERDELFAYFSGLATELDDAFPMFEALWPHIVLPVRERGSLLALLLVYRKLDTALDSNTHASIVIHDVEQKFRPAIMDVCEEHEVTVEDSMVWGDSIGTVLNFGLLIFFLDQVFSWILARLYYGDSVSEVLFFPFPNRFSSIASVVADTSYQIGVVVSPLTVSWLVNYDYDFEGADHVRPINTYTSIGAIYRQLVCLWSLLQQSIRGEWSMEQPLNARIRSDLDIDAPRSVHYACSVAVRIDVRFILTYQLYLKAIEKEHCSSVVVGGMSPKDRFALAAADDLNRELFYVPHTIICGSEVLPAQQGVTQFVAGEYAIEYLQDSNLYGELPNLVPAGRPYLDNLQRRPVSDIEERDSISVLLATQPFEAHIREEFVLDSLNAIAELPIDHDTTIKIHPSEDGGFYSELLERHEYMDEVVVESGDIEGFLEDSDLVITINSNVGLEAILKGAVTISYNKWTPNTTVFPYIDVGPIPLASNSMELKDIVRSLTENRLLELANDQRDFIDEGFTLRNSSERIVGYIESTTDKERSFP
jgi:hypothetical protein